MIAVQEFILVSAPNKTGESFVRLLLAKGIPFAAITNSRAEAGRLRKLGVKHFIRVDTSECESWLLPELPIGRVFLFESSLNLCCRLIQICRTWTSKDIYVITRHMNPRLVYRGLGADHVIHTSSQDVSFLIE
ncbi:hypothetical protein SK3146_04556 [Paenibacillus konkukensis]|uniref:Uncharacterized protein n=1 Tax=Paenibacillus konkukensis TaxID=2020716 RepID=A0ABY4RV32_9BACL|nr:hypothetical protein [Paenibacillus konkukensis]UQZ85267.1 hypothetical protein SK3146_04556 [Paenibacillus konkukensis]